MIVAENPRPTLEEFKSLMSNVDRFLNNDAKLRPDYYASKSGLTLEPDVRDAVVECAKHTQFEGTITLVSGSSFPDIVAFRYYGIEVKSTQKNHWTSIGSSILESTRIQDIERIYLTFGKLGGSVEFLSRPYEECLSGIAVTHYPRYQIDMNLQAGESIFDKMGIPYDNLRTMANPVEPVAAYYKSRLKEGESLWWTGSSDESVDAAVPATVRLWSTLEPAEKRKYESCFYVYFPECIMSADNRKYNRAILWLGTQCGIINSNMRDSFSAGGKVPMKTQAGLEVLMPRIFEKIRRHIVYMADVFADTDSRTLEEFWEEPVQADRPLQWINLVLREETDVVNRQIAESVLMRIFTEAGIIK